MAIKQITPQQSIDDYIDQQIERLIEAILVSFDRLGGMCVTAAKDSGTYKDQSGNLRNSIRYMVLYDGNTHTQGGSGPDADGDAFIRECAAKYPQGIVLVVTAGKNYAAYVEAMNYDVLTSSELTAEQKIPQILKQLGFKF